MRFCLNCGNPVGGSPWYCAGCGAPINPGPVRDVFAAQPAGPGQPGPLQADQDPPGYPGPVGWPDPWTPGNPALPAAVAAPGTGSAAPMWFDQPPPAGHPQAGGPAGAAAWQVRALHSRLHHAAASQPTSRTPPSDPARPSATAHTGSAGPAAGASGGLVSVAAGAAGRPHAGAVLTLLDSYFTAINDHDFPAYRRLFIPAIQAGMRHFGAGYASTVDSAATLTGLIVTGPAGLAARVTFTSHQKPAASPDHAACDHWDITLFVRHRAGRYQIRRPQPGFPQSVRACG